MPGGWHTETNTSEYVSQLYSHAAAIGAVRLGVVHEAYSQVKRFLLSYLTEYYHWCHISTAALGHSDNVDVMVSNIIFYD